MNPGRRDFLKKTSLATLAGMVGIEPLASVPAAHPAHRSIPQDAPPINCGVIGYGLWGREIAATLGRLPEARLVAVCDEYDIMLRRAQRAVPEASRHSDYREVLDREDITTVFIATPTHQHRKLVEDALDAGKNVYCEAPMASSIEDARAIALAAKAHPKQIFQVGQLFRTEPQYRSVFQFVRSGAIGRAAKIRAQWHSKQSWRRVSPSREREIAANWRLDDEVSVGLIGEEGIHQIDVAGWFLQERPIAVSGFGSTMFWDDGRKVPDTVTAVFQYPSGVRLTYDATLVSSFDRSYEIFHGSDSTIMLRDQKGWMFKEIDAPMIGWEVYARKDAFYTEKGIALVANATKLDAQATDPTARDPNLETPLWFSMKEFMENHYFGPFPPSVDYQLGYESAVLVIKAHEATMRGTTISLEDSLFEIA